MVTSAIFIALLGTINLKPAISAAISSEPIQITVNENFNTPSGQVSREFQSLEPGIVHQGANFYFKPKLTLPSSSVPHHIEALISLIQQHHSCSQDATKEIFENKLMEVLKPFMYAKETATDIVLEEENNSKTAKPSSILITEETNKALPPPSFNSISRLVEEELKKEKSETKSVPKEPIVIEIEPKPSAPELVLFPEAPVLPTLSADEMRIIEEVQREELKTVPESIVVDIESKPATPELFVIPEAPVLPPLSFDDISAFVEEEVKKEESAILEETKGVSEEPLITVIALKPAAPELQVIPEAPVLPPLSYNDVSAFVEEGIKKEESVILEKAKGVSEEPIVIEVEPKPVTTERVFIPDAPVLPPFSADEMRIVEEVQREELKTVPESIVVDIESKPATPEFLVIPEAPVLPPLSFNDISAFVVEEVKKEESQILEEIKGVSEEPIIIEIEPKPSTPELLVIPEAPVLPPFSADEMRVVEEMQREELKTVPESIVVDIKSKPATPELFVIPEAPVLPPLSFKDVSAFVEEGIKKEESVILEKPKSVPEKPIVNEIEPKPVAPERVFIPDTPVLPPLSADEMRIVEEVQREELKTAPESIVVDIESKPATPELLVIPEAPVLTPLSFNDISAFVVGEVKKEESVILEETKGVSVEPIVIEIKPKPVSAEHLVIPEAPVLPTLPVNGIRIVEEVKIEEPKTVPESIVVDIESKSATPEILVIPEAPVLPPLSFNDISAFVIEEVKKEESEILEETKGVSEEPLITVVAIKPASPELQVIPEAPVLPPLSYNDVSAFVEEGIKKEESVILEKAKGVSEEPIVIEVEPKPVATERIFIPDAPVLPPFSADEMRIVEEVQREELKTVPESIVVDIESKPATPEFLVIPEAPVLPPLSFNDISAFVVEEVKKEESVILEETKGVSDEPIVIEIEPKPSTPELLVIPEAPVLPPFSADEMRVVEEVQREELKTVPESIVVDIESKPATPELIVIPEAPVLPPLSYKDVSAFVEEGIKKEESVILEKPKSVPEEPIVNEIEPKPVAPERVFIPDAPVLPPLSADEMQIIEEVQREELKTAPESIVVDIESLPATPELLVIPEGPVLPPLSYNDVSASVEEGIKKEESEILEKAKGVSEEPIVIEVEPKPITPELVFIPEAPVLSPLSENRKPLTPLHFVNPKLPMLPPLTFKDIRTFVEEEMKKKESVILEEIIDTLQEKSTNEIMHETTTSELVKIPEAPVLPSHSKYDIRIVEETKIDKPMTLPMTESIAADIEPKPATPELLAIPEVPVLPPLSFNDISAFVEEEIKKKDESIKLEESISVPHEPSIIEIETKPATPERLVIPEAPMLQPLSYNDVSAFVEEGIKKEESVILEKAQGVSEEPIVLEVEPKPAIRELVIIPEAPVLPSMSDITATEEVKSEETIISEEFTGRIPETSARPALGSFVETQTVESYALEDNKFPVAAEELKIEIPILLEESIEVFPPIAESSRPTLQEYKMSNSFKTIVYRALVHTKRENVFLPLNVILSQ